MTSSNINNVRLTGRSATIDHLGDELKEAKFETTRGPRFFSALSQVSEYVDVLVPASTSALSILAGIIMAKARYGKLKVKFREGPVSEIEANSVEEISQILKTAKEVELD